MSRNMQTAITCILGVILTLPAQQLSAQIVVPNSLTSVEGNTNLLWPWGCGHGGNTSLRQQQVYLGSEVGSGTIAALRFRQDSLFGSAFGPTTLPSVLITLSSTPADPDSLSQIFDDNVGPDVNIVYDGPLTLSSCESAAIPRQLDVFVSLSSTFSFDSSSGQNLLMDVTIDPCVITTWFDAENTLGDSVSRIFRTDASATTGLPDTIGIVTQFLLADHVFDDGFECGDTSSWSRTVP